MSTVQIAIHDGAYAAELQRLLIVDGDHQVHLVKYPSPALAGIVVADATVTNQMISSQSFNIDKCILFAGQQSLEANRFFDAGIRQVIHADCPPHLGRLIVLAAERRLAC